MTDRATADDREASEDEVRALAGRDDWRRAVEALALTQRGAQALRVRVLRARAFGPPSGVRRRRRGGR